MAFDSPELAPAEKDTFKLVAAIKWCLQRFREFSTAYLTDYEEGSWTPVLTFATPGDLAVTYSTQVGRYVKIGRLVLAQFAITTATFTHTTASGGLQITGVPFTSLNVSGVRSRVGCLWQGVTKANYTDMAVTLAENSTTISIAASGSGQNAVALAAGDLPNGGGVRFDAALCYIADE